jgi:3-hydroxyacyl-CoA dehydrogenase
MLLAGKNAVIYGAGGLGDGIARTFAGEGVAVVLQSIAQMTTLRRAPARRTASPAPTAGTLSRVQGSTRNRRQAPQHP